MVKVVFWWGTLVTVMVPSMGFHGSFDDGEAQSRSLDFRGVMGFHPVETVEEEGEAFRGNAHAVSVTVMTQASGAREAAR